MRKRIAIGLLAVVVIGVVGFLISQPKEGSVEWHKREYFAAMDRATGNTWRDRVERVYHNIRKSAPPAEPWGLQQQKNAEKMSSNFTALLRIGYLTKRRFVLNNQLGSEVESAIRKAFDCGRTAFVRIESTTNVLLIAAPTAIMPQLEELFKKRMCHEELLCANASS